MITSTVMATTDDSEPAATGPDDAGGGTTAETFPRTRAEAARGEAPTEAAFPIGGGVPIDPTRVRGVE
ncbi:hypothetical protein ACIQVC_28310 [Streptomyces sp. NPDC101112]|uniref:hypothetical protein n=1 Tax=Streptomyces sp. NPDC101112 TaxID=3366105 RepID=UPI003815BA23